LKLFSSLFTEECFCFYPPLLWEKAIPGNRLTWDYS
jgi:hypothetical protein